MSLLFKNFRVHQVFGANTDVGKTILTAGLVRASAAKKKRAFYLKPVSTGPMQDADDEHVKRHAGPHRALVNARCLYRFDEPVSPHLAADMAAEKAGAQNVVVVPTDDAFVTSIASYIRKCACGSTQRSHMYIETAGGVHSPTLSGTTQVDSYRPLFLPTILVGDSRLGGISSTISAYESLLLRGYTVDSVLLFRDSYYRNWEYLEPYFAEHGIKVSAVDPPPPREADAGQNFIVTEEYYRTLTSDDDDAGGLLGVVEHLDERHDERIKELHSMPRRTLDTIWWPFVQHGLFKDERGVNVIDSAWGDHFTVFNGHRPSSPPSGSMLEAQFDGSASWWTQALGHAHPALTLAAARAAGRYGHVMYPQATHAPALRLAERLVHDGPGKGWASRAFISDNGSTGMEIALKMALRVSSKRLGLAPQERKKMGVLGLKGSYHGDTIGAMDACEEGVYTCEWHQAKGYWFEPPHVGIKNGRAFIGVPSAVAAHMHTEKKIVAVEGEGASLSWIYNVPARLDTPLASAYREHVDGTLEKLSARGTGGGTTLGALVLEPLVLGAGGMVFVDPLFQRVLVDSARARGLPVIFDEVFAGLWRLGLRSAMAPLLGGAGAGTGTGTGAHPDVAVYAKALTGGLVPLAVTLASEDVFRAFVGEGKGEALLHGHSYSAYAVGCEVANVALDRLERIALGDRWSAAREAWRAAFGSAGKERERATVADDADSDSDSDGGLAVWSVWSPQFIDVLSKLDVVDHAMTLGTVLAFKVKSGDCGYGSHSAQALLKGLGDAVGGTSREVTSAPGGAPVSIHFRTLGDVAYFMTSLNTPPATIRAVEDRVWALLGR
ncbi:onanonoxo-7-onima-8-eninoihtemlysoneda [Russula dissimulans]|nr:onanonoxo-7-onima-8-eninoihtemlysoneda [Russula dissimulans]